MTFCYEYSLGAVSFSVIMVFDSLTPAEPCVIAIVCTWLHILSYLIPTNVNGYYKMYFLPLWSSYPAGNTWSQWQTRESWLCGSMRGPIAASTNQRSWPIRRQEWNELIGECLWGQQKDLTGLYEDCERSKALSCKRSNVSMIWYNIYALAITDPS